MEILVEILDDIPAMVYDGDMTAYEAMRVMSYVYGLMVDLIVR